ncbi:leucyl/phenylalanyl-tRNA--protein transferase [Lichenihabitans psoromatis]|uniref:leucyl/phenylalanyl-tRNA--protein transferase n=1 Tax=Lichenihabitans psoromatis TaxID=2528642 RepID=UPI00103835D5|nr:leucyl/phenylalanyl-tRNA--protein transferase [Lichenihabitans psoromatis]
MRRPRQQIAITPDIILRAYSIGLFPMAETAEDEALFWVDPEDRGVFDLTAIAVSKSLAKTIRSDRFEVVADRDFDSVIAGCSAPAPGRDNTWINARIRSLFGDMFAMGHVHTIEAYENDTLVGGLYGLHIGAAFFGESMFHRATDASKVCLVHLAARLIDGGFTLLDTQFITPHLASLGAMEIPKTVYRARLAAAIEREATFHPFGQRAGIDGTTALAIVRNAKA